MDFSQFIKKEEGIYSEFRDTSKIELEGIVPKKFGLFYEIRILCKEIIKESLGYE